MTISVDDDDNGDSDSSGLSRLASANLTETVAALDASLTINGLALSSSSNELEDAIDGVDINLKATTDQDETVTLTVTDNTAAISLAVNEFVSGFNDLWTALKELTSFDSDTGTGSVDWRRDGSRHRVANQVNSKYSS